MDEEEFENKQENGNGTLRDIFDEFIEEEAGDNVPKSEFSEEFKKLSDKVLRYIDRMLGFR